MKPIPRTSLAFFPLAIVLAVFAAIGMSAVAMAEEEIVPSTAVARLKVAKGKAWVLPADSGEWEEYTHNSPVVERSRVSIPYDSESEIQFRGSQFLLLQGGAEVDVRQLGEKKSSFRLRSGRVAFSLSKEDFAPVTVKLPGNRGVAMDAPGIYWLTVDGTTTTLTVRSGEGTVSGEGMTSAAVKGGEEASIGRNVRITKTGAAADSKPPAEANLTEAEREAGIPGAAATELRGYGEWVWTSEYGYVWRPNVADDWTPYYYGRWAWVYPYGWNWVGYEPWGWWPYHYGWWVSVGAWGWVWAPCNSFYSTGTYYHGYPYSYRYGHYYPANVRFVNDGRHVRWVPLPPGQRSTRTAGYSRTDTRLARWNQPMPGGKAARSAGQAIARPFPGGGGRVSAVPARSGTAGRGNPGSYRPGAGYAGSAAPRSGIHGYASPSPRGSDRGNTAYGSAPSRSFQGGGSRGTYFGSRNFGGGGSWGGGGGGWGGGGGGRVQGGGFRGGGGARTR
jgi:hypothetical protein